jgi:drug/metabolite transporter (DMT)-like permease
MNLTGIASSILVGVLWGCTNPLLRKGSTQTKTKAKTDSSAVEYGEDRTLLSKITKALSKFRYIGVWLPYLLNQSGSLLYYKVLADSDLTLAVPICNSLALLFSIVTSFVLGERVDKPVQAMIGAALVMVGVGLCISHNGSADTTTGDPEL